MGQCQWIKSNIDWEEQIQSCSQTQTGHLAFLANKRRPRLLYKRHWWWIVKQFRKTMSISYYTCANLLPKSEAKPPKNIFFHFKHVVSWLLKDWLLWLYIFLIDLHVQLETGCIVHLSKYTPHLLGKKTAGGCSNSQCGYRIIRFRWAWYTTT